MDEDENKEIILLSASGDKVPINWNQVVTFSTFIRDIIEELDEDEDEDTPEIPLRGGGIGFWGADRGKVELPLLKLFVKIVPLFFNSNNVMLKFHDDTQPEHIPIPIDPSSSFNKTVTLAIKKFSGNSTKMISDLLIEINALGVQNNEGSLLFDLLDLSNFVNCPSLIRLLLIKIAYMLTGKSKFEMWKITQYWPLTNTERAGGKRPGSGSQRKTALRVTRNPSEWYTHAGWGSKKALEAEQKKYQWIQGYQGNPDNDERGVNEIMNEGSTREQRRAIVERDNAEEEEEDEGEDDDDDGMGY